MGNLEEALEAYQVIDTQYPETPEVIPEEELLNSGGSFLHDRRLRNKKRSRPLVFRGDTDDFDMEVEPIEVKETSKDVQTEIVRVEDFSDSLRLRIKTAQNEINLIEMKNFFKDLEKKKEFALDMKRKAALIKANIDQLIRREMLLKDIIAAVKFINELFLQAKFLKTVKRRREEEEMLISIIMLEGGSTNITFY